MKQIANVISLATKIKQYLQRFQKDLAMFI